MNVRCKGPAPLSFRAPLWARLFALAFFLTALFPTLGLSACDPCQALSNRICDCQPTPGDQQRCRIARDEQRNQRDVTDEDREKCAAALETCTCDALDENQVELCGLTR
jgi:hypothetical protein